MIDSVVLPVDVSDVVAVDDAVDVSETGAVEDNVVVAVWELVLDAVLETDVVAVVVKLLREQPTKAPSEYAVTKRFTPCALASQFPELSRTLPTKSQENRPER